MGRIRTLAWAALVLGLLVLPTAISAAQDPAPGEAATGSPAQGVPVPPEPPPPDPAPGPGPGAPQGSGSPGSAVEISSSPASRQIGSRARRFARAAAAFSVSIGNNFYSPATITIGAGDTVTWTNNGSVQHSATATDGSFDTGIFGPGGSRSHTFTQPGTFHYFCLVHGTAQSGTIVVSSSSSGGGDDDGGGGSGVGGGRQSEASAVASAGAAGSGATLPLTGEDVLVPLAVGILLLLAGLGLRLRGPADRA